MTNPNNNAPAATGNPAAAPSPTPVATATPAAGAPKDSSGDVGKENSRAWVTPEVQKAMDFDPFTPAGDELNPNPPAKTEGGSPTEGTTTVVQPASQPVVQPIPNGGTPQATGADAELKELRETNQRLLNAVLSSQQPKPGAQANGSETPQNGQPQETDPFKAMPNYEFNLHDQLITQMNSENPVERKQAIGLLVKGVAQGIHATVMQQVAVAVQNLQKTLPQQMQASLTQQQQSQAVESDFYGKFPQLKTKELRSVVGQVFQDLSASGKYSEWNAQLRDDVGAEVIRRLTGILPAAASAPTPAPQPAMFGGTSAAGQQRTAGSGPKTQLDHMNDVF